MKGHYGGDGGASRAGSEVDAEPRARVGGPDRWAVGAGRSVVAVAVGGGGRRWRSAVAVGGGGRRSAGAMAMAMAMGASATARTPVGRLTYASSGCQTVFRVRKHFLGAGSAPGGENSHQESLLTPRFLAPSTTVAPARLPGWRLALPIRCGRIGNPPPPEGRHARAAVIGRRQSPGRRRWGRSPKTTRPVPRRCACGSSRPDRAPRCRTPGSGSCLAPARPGRS